MGVYSSHLRESLLIICGHISVPLHVVVQRDHNLLENLASCIQKVFSEAYTLYILLYAANFATSKYSLGTL